MTPEPPPATNERDTKDAILGAAERLFAAEGIARASLRAITSEANVNLAAVNYHFGTKEGLVRAVLARRLGPLAERRRALLDRAQRDAGGSPRAQPIVRAFVQPALEMVDREPGGHAFARFLLGVFQDPRTEMRELLFSQFEETIQRFTSALAEALPELSREEIFWRFHFMVGVMAHTIALGSLVGEFSGGICDPFDVDGVTERMVTFLVGGFESPATTPGAQP